MANQVETFFKLETSGLETTSGLYIPKSQDPKQKAFYARADTFEQIEEVIREYEIEHVVTFICHRGAKIFNAGHGQCST